ncbi:hypothetical protein MGYG_00682 [Nannizzia gypsea CBS 118893]|uniref:Rhodopsin domain-containing protein n=1 Tax=Arthroderma gypseum (strain ATCC MYA-4604 / CBS 118893) TaxID=535722 RepID=E5R140_ARTGP|nr:hypothetical protein MGYG_00682 [Nannizzia gypsea CBS 118893]EFQ97644.1 hypothetical protein MGYG_00682 [Nannizzia gypsea CBS 118893]
MSKRSVDPLYQPFIQPTSENHSPWVIVSTCLFMIITFSVTTTTLIARFRVLRTLAWSDWFLLFAAGICINFACLRGLGRKPSALRKMPMEGFEILIYIGQILALASLACSKASITLLLISIKPLKCILLMCRILLGILAIWGLAGVLSLSLQCGLAQPWKSAENCWLNQYALHVGLNIGSMITDFALVLLPFLFVSQVQIPFIKKLAIAALFGMRLIVPSFTIVMTITSRSYFSSPAPERSWLAVMPTIWMQAILCVSVVATCIPNLKRLLAVLRTGLMAGTVNEFYELSVSGGDSKAGTSGSQARSGKTSYSKENYSNGTPRPSTSGGSVSGTPTMSSFAGNASAMRHLHPETAYTMGKKEHYDKGYVVESKVPSCKTPIFKLQDLLWERSLRSGVARPKPDDRSSSLDILTAR